MIRLTDTCTIKIPAHSILEIDPKHDQTGYNVQIIQQDTGEVLFHGYFGITTPKEGDFSLDMF